MQHTNSTAIHMPDRLVYWHQQQASSNGARWFSETEHSNIHNTRTTGKYIHLASSASRANT
jgi:hypothetical protein